VITVICVLVLAAAWMARSNTRLKRSDTRGAARLAAFVLATYTLQYFLFMYYLPNGDELGLIVAALSKALFQAAVVWLIYLAVEPFVRRRWPQTIVSWSRILSGKLRDPLVGADILIGVAFGLFWSVLLLLMFLYGQTRGDAPNAGGVDSLLGLRYLAAGFVGQLASSVGSVFASFFMMFLLRVVLRKQWLAAAAFVALWVAQTTLSRDELWTIPFEVVVYGVFALLVLRYGIVPLIVSVLTADCLLNAPITLDFSSWYIASSLVSLLLFLGIALYGFRCTLAGKPLFDLE
jgi:serine/threonine-protein kinase